MTTREIFFISGSPPCWSVMLAMAVKGLDYLPRRLDNAKREQKAPAFLAINPRGNVPVLTDGDTVVCETLAILAYLEASVPSPPLFGATPQETAKIWQAISDCDGNLRDRIGNLSRPMFRGKAAAAAEEIGGAIPAVRDEIARLEEILSNSAWIAGDSLSAADLMIFPLVMQLMRAAGREDAVPLNLRVYPLEEFYPNVASWVRRIEQLPGYDGAYPPHWK